MLRANQRPSKRPGLATLQFSLDSGIHSPDPPGWAFRRELQAMIGSLYGTVRFFTPAVGDSTTTLAPFWQVQTAAALRRCGMRHATCGTALAMRKMKLRGKRTDGVIKLLLVILCKSGFLFGNKYTKYTSPFCQIQRRRAHLLYYIIVP